MVGRREEVGWGVMRRDGRLRRGSVRLGQSGAVGIYHDAQSSGS